MKNKFIIRVFFDFSAISCLWTGNDNAESRWGYNINLDKFPISENLKSLIISAQNDFENLVDLNFKAKNDKKLEADQLNKKCIEIIHLLKNELGDEFSIIDRLKIETT